MSAEIHDPDLGAPRPSRQRIKYTDAAGMQGDGMTPEQVMATAYRVAGSGNPHVAATLVSVREIRCMAELLVNIEEALRARLLGEPAGSSPGASLHPSQEGES